MEELTLEGIGWTWSGPTKMVWDADTCTLTIVVANAAVPPDQDELREDLEVTFRNVTYFKVIREPEWQLDQIKIDFLQELDDLPSLNKFDMETLPPKVFVRNLLFGREPIGGVIGNAGEIRRFAYHSSNLVAEFTASGYSIVRLSQRA